MKIPKQLDLMPASYPSANDIARELQQQTRAIYEKQADAPVKVVEKLPDTFIREVVNIATNVWRLRSKTIDSSGETLEQISKEDTKKIGRYIEGIFESLKSLGIEVKDRTGETFDYGLPEKVVTTLPQQGITKERIIETLRPTIYWQTHIAQLGEVVIATPDTTGNAVNEASVLVSDSDSVIKEPQAIQAEQQFAVKATGTTEPNDITTATEPTK